MQSKVVVPQLLAAPRRRSGTPVIWTSLVREQLTDAFALALVVFDHEHPAQALRELGFQLLQRLDQLLALDRLERVADGAELQRFLRVVGDRERRAPECGASAGLRLS